MNNIDIDQQRRDYFIEPSLSKMGMAFYAVRTALLKAVNELKLSISGQVLDVGCGIMPYRQLLQSSGRITKYIGMDLPPTEYHNVVRPDIFWDGKTIPLDDNSVDWVIATEFLEHYFDTGSILKEIHRVLKKDGTIFFTVPCIWPLHEVPYDEYRFTPFSLEKHLNENKFTNIKISSLGGYNRSLATMVALWLDYSGIKKSRKKILQKLFLPVFKILIKKDSNFKPFQNNQMPSGLYGFANAIKG